MKWPMKWRKSGLYECTQCHWYYIKSGKQWRGALWHQSAGPGRGISRMLEGHLSTMEIDEFADCIRHLQRVK